MFLLLPAQGHDQPSGKSLSPSLCPSIMDPSTLKQRLLLLRRTRAGRQLQHPGHTGAPGRSLSQEDAAPRAAHSGERFTISCSLLPDGGQMCRGADSDGAAAGPCGSPWLEPAAGPAARSIDPALGGARIQSAAPAEA